MDYSVLTYDDNAAIETVEFFGDYQSALQYKEEQQLKSYNPVVVIDNIFGCRV